MGGRRDGRSNFKFFEIIEPHYADPSVTLVTSATVDTQGYETLAIAIQHSVISLASVVDQMDVYIEKASQSAAGIDAWQDCVASDIFGVDMPRLLSVLTMDSWLALDALTRASYAMSIPVYASTTSGHVLAIGISVTSQAQMITDSFVHVIGYKGKERYVRILISASTNISYVPLNALAIQGAPANWPASVLV
jgi:hypothetical protein